MAIPGAEREPNELRAPWSGFWRQALKAMKDQGTWSPQQRPLLDLYVQALRLADEAENPADHDRHAKRASALADQLALTPRGRKAVDLGDSSEVPADPFSALDAGRDELSSRRANRA